MLAAPGAESRWQRGERIRAGSVAYVTDPSKWVIHGERLVDDTPHIRVSLADVELPNHVRFTQYVFRMRRCAMTVVLDDAGDRVLLMRRHRFIVDRWVWELPGGYVDDGEDPAAAAAREVAEETGWRPRVIEYVMSCQPILSSREVVGFFYGVAGGRSPSKIAVRVRRWRSLSQPALERALACAGEQRFRFRSWPAGR